VPTASQTDHDDDDDDDAATDSTARRTTDANMTPTSPLPLMQAGTFHARPHLI